MRALFVVLAGLLSSTAHAQDATWLLNPGTSAFNTGANWSTGTVPTGTASFGTSNTASINFNATTLGGITFNAGASAFTFSAVGATISFTGAGIVNNSGRSQTFGLDATSQLTFNNSSSAASATINNSNTLNFFDSSTAGTATINNNNGGTISFDDNATAGNATINNNNGATLCFCNDATPGNVTITNATGGTVNFQGNNAGNSMRYIGSGGTLDLSGMGVTSMSTGSIEGSGSIVLGSNNLTVGTLNTSTIFSGVLSGTGGSLTKTGSGTLTLSGTNTFTGGTIVSAGRLALTGSLASGVTVNSGGNLGGTGTVTGNVTNNGILSPGNSIGTLTITGNYTQNAGSTYQVEVNASGQGDRINATGTATINGGTVAVTAASGTYGNSTTYTILNATGGRTGTYSGVTGNLPFLAPSLSYDANNVFLTLTRSFTPGAQTNNQRAVAGALDRASPTATGDFGTVIGTIAGLSTSQGPVALDVISGQNYAGFSTVAVQSVQAFMTNFAQQAGSGSGGAGRIALADGSDGATCGIDACDVLAPARWGAWGGGVAGAGTVAGDASSHGVSYNLGGFAAGLDYRFDPRFLAGVTAGYTTSTQYTQGIDGRGTSDSVQLGVYASFIEGAFYLDALAGYARGQNYMQRPIVITGLQPRTAQGSTHVDQFFGQLESGYRVELGGSAGAFVTPFARLQGSTANQAAFTESGADSLDLSVAQQTINSLRSVFGSQLGGVIEKVNVVLRLGWSHEYADTSRPVTASFAGAPALAFTTNGAAAPRDGAIVGLAAAADIAEAASLYARYDGEVQGGNTSHIFSAGVRVVW